MGYEDAEQEFIISLIARINKWSLGKNLSIDAHKELLKSIREELKTEIENAD